MKRFFPAGDSFWTDVAAFLRLHAADNDCVLAPREFLEEMHQACGYGILYAFPLAHYDLVVLHKGMYDYFPPETLFDLEERFIPVFANEVFIVFSVCPLDGVVYRPDDHYHAFTSALKAMKEKHQDKFAPPEPDRNGPDLCAVVVTTYDRPAALERSLPQIAAAGSPVLVVDDGSHERNSRRNRETAAACGVRYLELPGNRGIAAAINAGVSFWLADPRVSWISCFQDDVDVHPEIFSALSRVQDPADRPILTGRLSGRHPVFGNRKINGEDIVLMRGISGQHIHAHREYWQGVLPIPAPCLGAPNTGGGLAGQGPEEDYWISAWSPASITKRGGYVACLPGLVRAFLNSEKDSTWGRELGEEDGPLRGAGGGCRAE